MALTWSDYEELRKELYRNGAGKEEMKALLVLPTKAQLLATFQAVDTFWEDNRTLLFAQMRAAYGQNISPMLAKKISLAWLKFKIKKGG